MGKHTPPFTRINQYFEFILRENMPVDFPEWLAAQRKETEAGACLQEPTSDFVPTHLNFDGQPDGLFEDEAEIPYRGQDAAKQRIRLHVQGLGKRLTRFKTLLTGPAGIGKTTLAHIIARMIQIQHLWLGQDYGSYWELTGAQVETKAQLDAFMQEVAKDPNAIVFIDEAHTLVNLEALFHVLHDTGTPWYPMSTGLRLEVANTISWIFATTNPGALDTTVGGAMRRRLEPEIRLEVPTKDVLAQIIRDAGAHDRFPVHPDAAYDIAERSVFPWQAKLLYNEASLVAAVDGVHDISPEHAAAAFRSIDVDAQGMLREDRDVIRCLLRSPYRLASRPDIIRYRMSEEALCAAAGVDRSTYRTRIQPKLVQLGYLTTVGGQSLTEKALADYGYLESPG